MELLTIHHHDFTMSNPNSINLLKMSTLVHSLCGPKMNETGNFWKSLLKASLNGNHLKPLQGLFLIRAQCWKCMIGY